MNAAADYTVFQVIRNPLAGALHCMCTGINRFALAVQFSSCPLSPQELQLCPTRMKEQNS